MAGLVINPTGVLLGDGTSQANNAFGKQGEQIGADLHGPAYEAACRGKVFKFNRTAVTVPVVAATLVSVFGLYNPATSGVIAEVITTEVGQVLATTVVDTLAWYVSFGSNASGATFTTPAVANTSYFSARIGEVPGGQVVPYNAVTHVGTPVRVELIAAFGATTDAVVMPSVAREHKGGFLIMPGTLASLAMSTAAGTASGLDLGVTWAEFPYHAV